VQGEEIGVDKTVLKHLMAVYQSVDGKTHATQKYADSTYCGIFCAHWEYWEQTDGSDVDCKRCRKSLVIWANADYADDFSVNPKGD
jgi:hypothetical protein